VSSTSSSAAELDPLCTSSCSIIVAVNATLWLGAGGVSTLHSIKKEI
jgi:hypothetical protein